MKLSIVQNQALQALVAAVIGADEFDRLFAGIDFEEVEDSILYVSAKDEDAATEIEDTYSLHICTLAMGLLSREIDIVMVRPILHA